MERDPFWKILGEKIGLGLGEFPSDSVRDTQCRFGKHIPIQNVGLFLLDPSFLFFVKVERSIS